MVPAFRTGPPVQASVRIQILTVRTIKPEASSPSTLISEEMAPFGDYRSIAASSAWLDKVGSLYAPFNLF